MPRVSASRDRSSRKANGDAIRSWLKDASAAGPEDEARRDLDGRDDSVPRGRRGARRSIDRSFVRSIDRSIDRSTYGRRRASSSSRRPRDTLNRNPKPPTYPTPSVHPAELSKEDVDAIKTAYTRGMTGPMLPPARRAGGGGVHHAPGDSSVGSGGVAHGSRHHSGFGCGSNGGNGAATGDRRSVDGGGRSSNPGGGAAAAAAAGQGEFFFSRPAPRLSPVRRSPVSPVSAFNVRPI